MKVIPWFLENALICSMIFLCIAAALRLLRK